MSNIFFILSTGGYFKNLCKQSEESSFYSTAFIYIFFNRIKFFYTFNNITLMSHIAYHCKRYTIY